MKRRWVILSLGLAVLLLTGCSDFVDVGQSHVLPEAGVILEAGHPVGQTFVAYHGGLDGVEVWLEPVQGGLKDIVLHLRADSQAQEDLAVAALPLAQVTEPGFYRFSFPPRRDSHGEYFYVFLEMSGEGQTRVGAGPGDAYLNGALYRNHEPLDAQMGFRLIYDPWWIVVDLGWAAVKGVGLLVVAGLLYVVPGWALLAWLWRGKSLSWAEGLGIATGLSLAVYPLLFLWTDLVGLHLGPLYAWLPVLGGLAALVWRYRDWRPRAGADKQRSLEALRQWARSEALWPDLALLMVLAMVFGVRLLVVRTLDAPMWGDSYQHTMIAQLLVDNGGLFDSWEPYAELQSFTYHFGFHADMAVLHWLTGMEMVQSVLWGAQILNGLAVLALYPLAVRVSGNRWAGVGAVLVAGLLSPMPMYYVNWGRYTQLAGQVVLPAAVLLTWSALEAPCRDWRLIVLCWLAVGGLALTHYRVLVFYVIFVLAWMLLALRRRTWRRALARVTWVGVGAGVLFLPWFVHAFTGKILSTLGEQLKITPGQLSFAARKYNAIGDLTHYLPLVVWLILLVAVAVGLWQRRRGALLISLWWFLLLLIANPGWLGFPGSGALTNFALFIAAYILAGVLIGDMLGQLASQFRFWRWFGIVATLIVIGVGIGGTRVRSWDARMSKYSMISRPDSRAMEWIQENIPGESRFLVNSFFAYDGSVIVGSDGGWWLPLLAQRENTVPPYTYDLEQELWPGCREWINSLTEQLQKAEVDDPATLTMLKEHGVTHVYVGQQQGRVNYGGPHVLNPEGLLRNARYQMVYYRDRVWVFKIMW